MQKCLKCKLSLSGEKCIAVYPRLQNLAILRGAVLNSSGGPKLTHSGYMVLHQANALPIAYVMTIRVRVPKPNPNLNPNRPTVTYHDPL